MARAVALASRVRPSPNPPVGAVIVRDDEIVGEGFHPRAGGPHAEIVALDAAGEAARGATVFVTLEPCNHHGRTPPCTEALVAAGVSRVVYAVSDPNPSVAGRGGPWLEAHGVAASRGFDPSNQTDAERCIAPWSTFIRERRSHVVVKVAQSLDGRIATRTGESKWITSPEARADGHRLRASVDAILVGSRTVAADDPALTVRGVPFERPPVRVVIDSGLSLGHTRQLAATARTLATWVVTTEAHDAARRRALEALGVRVLSCGPGPRVDLRAALARLAQEGVVSCLSEGGGGLHGALIDADLVDRVVIYTAPLFLGAEGAPAFGARGPERLGDAVRLHNWRTSMVGPDLRIEAERAPCSPG